MNDDAKVLLDNGKTRRMMFSFKDKETAIKFWMAILERNLPIGTSMLVYPIIVDFDARDDEIATQLQELFDKYYEI